jgi:acylphosphatase
MRSQRVRAVVRGRVQGVFYRASTAACAAELGLVGWVRNRPDGAVELEAEGPGTQVERLLAWCRVGPPAARVEAVDVEVLEPTGAERRFEVRR